MDIIGGSNHLIVEVPDDTIEWSTSIKTDLPIMWIAIENEAPVLEKEVKKVIYRLKSEGDKFYADDTFLLKDMTNDRNMRTQKVYHELKAGDHDLIVFGAITDSEILNVHFVPKEAINADGSEYKTLEIYNNELIEVICSLNIFGEVKAMAEKVITFGPVDSSKNVIAEGDSVTFKANNLPDGLLIIEYDMC